MTPSAAAIARHRPSPRPHRQLHPEGVDGGHIGQGFISGLKLLTEPDLVAVPWHAWPISVALVISGVAGGGR